MTSGADFGASAAIAHGAVMPAASSSSSALANFRFPAMRPLLRYAVDDPLCANVDAAEPSGDLREGPPLLIGFQHEWIENGRARRVLSHDVHAPALPIAAVRNERH